MNVDALQAGDLEGANPSGPDRTMLEYAGKLTDNLSNVGEGDVEDLRTAGFTDRDILHINLIASFFNYINRVDEGLGVQLEEYLDR